MIDLGKKKAGAKKLELVGFSGGGAVAILVSARRLDVSGIRTVAGNIDHKVWTKRHKVSSLTGSLNPAHVADKVSAIPQIHYVGERDKVMGRYVAESFRSKAGKDNCVKIQTVPGVTHSRGWKKVWSELIATAIPDLPLGAESAIHRWQIITSCSAELTFC